MGCDDNYGSYYRASPEKINKDRRERREHRKFVWELHKKYRAQGDIFDHGKAECPDCGASIKFDDQEDHDDWHASLFKKMQEIARWTQPGVLG